MSINVGRTASQLTVLSLLSPISGLSVEVLLAWRFGISAIADAYRIGLLVGLLGWQVFIVQILPNVIVPIFAEYEARGDKDTPWRVTFGVGNALLVPITALSFWIFLRPEATLRFLGPGLTGDTAAWARYFISWFALTLGPFVWCGAVAGGLYAQNIFWTTTVSSSLGNITLIVLLCSRWQTTEVIVIGTLLAALETFCLHFICVLPYMRRVGLANALSLNILHQGVGKAFGMTLPLLATVASQEWWAILVNRALSGLPAGYLASFGYAWKMGQIVSIAPAALSLVLFPGFSRSCQDSGRQGLSQSGMKVLRMAAFISIPIAAICFVFHRSLLRIVFQRGAFSNLASNETSGIFAFVLIAGPAAVMLDFLQKFFYAAQRMWVPTIVLIVTIGGLSLGVHTAATLYGIKGVSLIAASLPCLQVILLVTLCSELGGDISLFGLARYGTAIALLALAWTVVGGIAKQAIEDALGSSTLVFAVALSSALMISLLGFGASAIGLRLPEAVRSMEMFRKDRSTSERAL